MIGRFLSFLSVSVFRGPMSVDVIMINGSVKRKLGLEASVRNSRVIEKRAQ